MRISTNRNLKYEISEYNDETIVLASFSEQNDVAIQMNLKRRHKVLSKILQIYLMSLVDFYIIYILIIPAALITYMFIKKTSSLKIYQK